MSRPKGSLNKATVEKQQHNDELIAQVSNQDGWSNILSGLGSAADKSIHTTKDVFEIIDDETLTNIYMSEGLGRRIVDIIADDETREWIYFDEKKFPAKDIKTINDELTRLSAESTYNEALKWQRLYGGSLIFIGAMDGRKPSEPLRENQIKNIEFLKVIDRTDVSISESVYDYNPLSPMFGKILQYKVNLHVGDKFIDMLIHYTRVVPFFNDPTPSKARSGIDMSVRYFGMSSLQSIYESIRDLGAVNQTTLNILMEFIISRVRIKDLKKILSMEGGEAAVAKRLQVMNASKSVINAVVMDSEDEMARDYSTVAGLPELIDRSMLGLSGTTGIPVTRLFGRSPAGLNATGENDLRNYYDLVEATQKNRLAPPIRRTVDLICAWKGIKKVPEFTFNSLYQLSEEEKSKIAKTDMETRQIEATMNNTYVSMGALDADEVRHDTLGLIGVVEVPEPVEPTEEDLNSLKEEPKKVEEK